MGRKDFNKGMEAGAKPFEDKFRQMGKEFKEFSNKMEQDIDRMKATNEAILDEMDSAQKKQYYRDNTAVDIAVLDKGDRETLLALLFTLAETEETVTEYQKMFIRSVKSYLEKTEDDKKPEKWAVLKNGDWSIIDTIVEVDETKAVVQAVMEYLFLGYGNHEEYLEEYEDMFECFNLNKKGFREIAAHIDNIYRATGLQGIAENYGYVPEKEENIEGEEVKIEEALRISANETKVFVGKKIVICNQILLEKNAKLRFKNCDISLDNYRFEKNVRDSSGCIVTEENCVVDFDMCTIGEMGRIEGIEAFISGGKGSELIISNSALDSNYLQTFYRGINETSSFYRGDGGSIVEIKHSNINLSTKDCSGHRSPLLECSYITISDTYIGEDAKRKADFLVGPSGIIDTATIEKEKSKDILEVLFATNTNEKGKSQNIYEDDILFKTSASLRIEHCQFYNCSNLIFGTPDTEISQTNLKNCTIGIQYSISEKDKDGVYFRDCILQDSTFDVEAHFDDRLRFEDTKLLNCTGKLSTRYMKDVITDGGYLYFYTRDAVEFTGCKFYNWSYKAYKYDYVGENGSRMAAIIVGNGSKLTNCNFMNLDLGEDYLITGQSEGSFTSCLIENCSFKNITTSSGVIRKQYPYSKDGLFGLKWYTREVNYNIKNSMGI